MLLPVRRWRARRRVVIVESSYRPTTRIPTSALFATLRVADAVLAEIASISARSRSRPFFITTACGVVLPSDLACARQIIISYRRKHSLDSVRSTRQRPRWHGEGSPFFLLPVFRSLAESHPIQQLIFQWWATTVYFR